MAVLPIAAAALFTGATGGLFGVCGPFTDVAADAFCPFVKEVFYFGITTGTTPTTYDPAGNVSRLQMAAFLSRGVDGVLRRGSPRAALSRFWSPKNETVLDVTTVGNLAGFPASDGPDVWVPSNGTSTVSRVRASDGKLLETWTGATGAVAALSAIGKIFVTAYVPQGSLYQINPRLAAGAVTTVVTNLGGDYSYHLTFDGARIWTANAGETGSVSIVTPGPSLPWTVTTVTAGLLEPRGALFDGSNVWVTDRSAGTLLKLGPTGAVLQTVTVGSEPWLPIFDGANIWVPNSLSASISVVRASTGAVLTTLTGNGLNVPYQAAFDGERVLVTNLAGASVSFWKAADLTVIGNLPTGAASNPGGACSDGINFWITFRNNQVARF